MITVKLIQDLKFQNYEQKHDFVFWIVSFCLFVCWITYFYLMHDEILNSDLYSYKAMFYGVSGMDFILAPLALFISIKIFEKAYNIHIIQSRLCFYERLNREHIDTLVSIINLKEIDIKTRNSITNFLNENHAGWSLKSNEILNGN